jgi:uncharacterized protein (TIGR03086 family)
MDIQDLNRRAVLQSVEIVSSAKNDQWELPTPCARWTLSELLVHMVAQNHGFAAAADGETEDASIFHARPLGSDPRQTYAESAERVIASFAADGVLEREIWLPEVRPVGGFPAPMAISFHFLDYVVHGWDVAAAIGVPAVFDDDLVAAAHDVTRRFVPDGPARRRPGSAFGPSVPVPDAASDFDRLLGLLGRSPRWPS